VVLAAGRPLFVEARAAAGSSDRFMRVSALMCPRCARVGLTAPEAVGPLCTQLRTSGAT
jgi:hypothetical protein